jgi:predicted nuclease of predicted toxin-antitoxin system
LKLKLDEHLGRRLQGLLRAEGHDVLTVRDQGLGGFADDDLFPIVSGEGRVLITLDRAFGDHRVICPAPDSGVILLRAQTKATVDVNELALRVLRTLPAEQILGSIVIADRNKVRVFVQTGRSPL